MNIKIQKSSHPRYPWELTAPKKMFGERVREFHKTKADAERSKAALMKEWEGAQVPLQADFALVAARYQTHMTVDEFEEALRDKKQTLSLTSRTFVDVQQEFCKELERLKTRGVVGASYYRDHFYGLARLADKLKKSPEDAGPLLRDIDKAMLDDFYDNELDLGYSPTTARNYFRFLSALYNWAIKQGFVTKNPTHDVRLVNHKPEVSILKPGELQKLLNHACWYTKCWILFGAFAGVRSSEIGWLRWEDIRLPENQFYIPGRKNVGAERWCKLTPPLRAFLEEALATGPRKGLIMNGMHGGNTTFRRLMASLYERAGMKIPANALRHSFGSHHLQAHQASYLTASEMGHVSPRTTYQHYRKAVTTKQAAEYWNVRTSTKCFSKAAAGEDMQKAA